jgi:hypothetical protein
LRALWRYPAAPDAIMVKHNEGFAFSIYAGPVLIQLAQSNQGGQGILGMAAN